MANRRRGKLTQRQAKILGAVVEEHVATAAPVGSKTVRERYGVDASTATIRNDMVELERMRYITQPHASAGRMPLDRGYRTYVDELMPQAKLRGEDLAWARGEFRTAVKRRHYLYRAAVRVLSCLTDTPAMAMAPPDEPIILQNIELAPVSSSVIRMRYETEPGGKNEVVLESRQPLNADQVAEISDALARRFCGRDTGALGLCTPQILNNDSGAQTIPENLLNQIKTAIERSRPQHVYVDGAAFALSYPEYQKMDRLRPLLEALDEEGVVRRLLRPASRSARPEVTIGHEHEVRSLRHCSSVAYHYAAQDDCIGALGVIGPTRLDYSVVLAAVKHLAGIMSEVLGTVDNGV